MIASAVGTAIDRVVEIGQHRVDSPDEVLQHDRFDLFYPDAPHFVDELVNPRVELDESDVVDNLADAVGSLVKPLHPFLLDY